jgi:ribosome-associated translation inhibitor RaiA
MDIVNLNINDFLKLTDVEQKNQFIKMINQNDYQDLLFLSFRIRDTMNYDMFYFMLFEIYKKFPEHLLSSMSLITNRYGIWEDILKMIDILIKTKDTKLIELEKSLIDMFQNKLKEDIQLIQNDKTPISNCVIWCPRENGNLSYIAKKIAIELFKDKLNETSPNYIKIAKRSCYKKYRQLCSYLKRHIFEKKITLNIQNYDYNKMKDYLLEYDFNIEEEEILIKPMKTQILQEIDNKLDKLEKEMTILKLKKKNIIQQFVYEKIIYTNDFIGSGRGY